MAKSVRVPCIRCEGTGSGGRGTVCSDCFGKKTLTRRKAIRQRAVNEYVNDGELEIDSNAKLSEGEDNGCYVQAWVWVDFSEIPELDKEHGFGCAR